MISRTSDKPDLNKYATKTLENDCFFVDLEGSKLCLSYLLTVISEKMFASYVFPDKNQKPLRMCRMQFSQSTSLTQSTLCLANPPSSFSILPFATANFPFFRSSFVNLTLLPRCLFLVFNSLHVSPTYTALAWNDYLVHSTFLLFNKWLLGRCLYCFTFLVWTPFETGVSKSIA